MARVVEQLVKLGVAEGHSITVACPPDGELANDVQAAGARHIAVDMRRSPHATDIRALWQLYRACRSSTVVFAHSSKAGVLTRLLRPVIAAPLYFIPHGWSWHVPGRLNRVYRAIERTLAPAADGIVCVGSTELRDGVETLRSRANLLLIENAIDPERFRAPASDDHRGSLLCVGRFTHQKGQDLLLRALRVCRNPRARLTLVGSGDPTELRELSNALGVSERVDFVGQADPLPHYYEASALVIPSRWEGLPLVLLEGMAAGCPTIASSQAVAGASVEGVRVIALDDEDRFVEDLATAIDEVLTDHETRSEMSQASRRSVLEHYNGDHFATSYSKLWNVDPTHDRRFSDV